jgi:hypothetical protein
MFARRFSTVLQLGLLALPLFLTNCNCDVEGLAEIPEPGSITGRLCDPGQGEGIAGAKVWVEVDYGGGVVDTIATETDENGDFELKGLPAGTYTVEFKRGSFTTEVEEVTVEEEMVTEIEGGQCIAAEDVVLTVYSGHDSVQDVLNRLGYFNFNVVETHHRSSDRDDNTPSWLVEHFADYEAFSFNDILFINCGAHEWAFESGGVANSGDLSLAMNNLRRFVEEGGSIYLSDWSYDLLEALYPNAVDWLGDDATHNDAEKGLAQDFLGRVQDAEMAASLGESEVNLKYELSRIAVPLSLGPGTDPLILANIRVEEESGEAGDYFDVPVLLRYRPTDDESSGRVIYTTFHNGNDNTEDMDYVLRAIIFSL